MPFGVIRQTMPPEVERLRERLRAEWVQPTPGAMEPLILVDTDRRRGDSKRLYVVWSEWGGLSQRERSEAIMDAYEAARGPQEALQVMVAMGLTPDEARRMGLEYETVEGALP